MELLALLYKQYILDFPTELLLACVLFLIPLAKRSPAKIRVPLNIVMYFVLAGFLQWVISLGIPREFGLIFLFILAIAFFFATAQITLWDAMFGAACAYAVQHLAYSLHTLAASFATDGVAPVLMEGLVKGAVYLLCYILFARNISSRGQFGTVPRGALTSVVLILPVAFWLSILAGNYLVPDGVALYLICRLYGALCCIFVLWVQTSIRKNYFLQQQFEAERLLWGEAKKQYEISKENIELINQKCHDLKHQVAALRAVQDENVREQSIQEIEKSVMLYDSVVKTGNEVLDTVLTEKSLICERQNISWTCMADGRQLAFIDVVDLYTMLGNALDNAIECVSNLTDPEHRVIAVTLYTKKDILILQIENYFDGAPVFEDGLPKSTKEQTGYHGYGLRSIRRTAEKYGGSVSVDIGDQIFLLCIVIPLP